MAQDGARRKVGTIHQLKDGTWSVRVSRGTRADGSRRTAYARVSGTREDAEAAAVRLASEMGRAVHAWSGLTLSQYYWGVFRDHPSCNGTVRAPSTLEQYDGVFRRSIEPTLGDRDLSGLRHADMKACVLDSTAPRKTKVVLRAVMRSAYDDGLTDERPFDRRIATPPVTRQKQLRAWDAQEAAEALKRLDGYPDPMVEAYAILGLSGLRCEEAMAVAPRDIHAVDFYDPATGTAGRSLVADVTHTYTQAGGVRPVAKNAFSHRGVPIAARGRASLLRIMNATRPDDPAEVEGWREHEDGEPELLPADVPVGQGVPRAWDEAHPAGHAAPHLRDADAGGGPPGHARVPSARPHGAQDRLRPLHAPRRGLCGDGRAGRGRPHAALTRRLGILGPTVRDGAPGTLHKEPVPSLPIAYGCARGPLLRYLCTPLRSERGKQKGQAHGLTCENDGGPAEIRTRNPGIMSPLR